MCATSNEKVHEFSVSIEGRDQKLVVHISTHTTHQEVSQQSGSPREVSRGTKRCPRTASKLLMIVSGTATRAHLP